MNKFIIIITIVFSAVASGCKKQYAPRETTVINADFKEAEPSFDLSNILEERVEIIPLETTDKSLIAEVSDVRIIDDEVFVIDNTTLKITVFDRKGKYLRNIGTIGRGPNEYMHLTACEVTDKYVAVFDKLTRKLYFYNLDGSFGYAKDVSDLWAMDIVEIGDKLYFVNASSNSKRGYYHMFELTREGEYVKSLLPFDERTADFGWGLGCYYSKNGDELLTYFTPRDSLFVVKNGDLKETCFVDFGPRKVPESVINIGYDALYTIQQHHYIKGVGRVHLTDKYIIITFREADDYIAIYYRDTGTCEVYNRYSNSLCIGLAYWFPTDIIRDNVLIAPMDVTAIKRWVGGVEYNDPERPKTDFQLRMVELAASLEEHDNPVLFVQKFK